MPCSPIHVSLTTPTSTRLKFLLRVAVLPASVAPSAFAQDITVRRTDGAERRLTAAEIATLPQRTFDAVDHGVATRFEGVDVRALLQLAGAERTDSLRGPALRLDVLLIGADGYAATVAIAGLDPSLGARCVSIANRANGQPLAAAQGPWRAILLDDLRAARWVRQLQRIELDDVRQQRCAVRERGLLPMVAGKDGWGCADSQSLTRAAAQVPSALRQPMG
jgi:hypothetical protein